MPTSGYQTVEWQMMMCGMAGKTPPVSFALRSELGTPSIEGSEYNVKDAATQTSFAGIVTSGGSSHYKIRGDGTNWIRIG
jgi:hypothetical protein